MFSYTYETRYGDFKNFDVLKTGALLDCVQDISIKDSSRLGFGIETLRKMNLAWLLQGINLRLLKPASTCFPLEVSTAVKTLKGATSERGCFIKQDGQLVAQVISNWFLFDTERNRIAKVPAEMKSSYEFYDFDDDFFAYKKPQICEAQQPQYEVKVSNKDLDTNMHLNNQKSAEMLMDALPFDFYFTDMKVLYKKPAYLGDKLGVCIKETENGYCVHLQTKENEVCVVGTFENI